MQLLTENNNQLNSLDPYSFAVSLDFFSGPMDLLLHLVQQQEVAIEKVSMRLIAEQYLAIISKVEIIDIDRASEYLVIAATLLAIKSSSLLPLNNLEEENPAEEPRDERFYQELREKLRIYQLTKQRAQALMQLPQLGVDVYSRTDRQALQASGEMLAEAEEVDTLALNFARLLKKIGGLAKTYAIRLEEVSVVSYMMKIIDQLFEQKKNQGNKNQGKRFTFSSIMQGFLGLKFKKFSLSSSQSQKAFSNRGVLIGSFAAVLELMKRGVLKASQINENDDIVIDLLINEQQIKDVDLLSSEFDQVPEDEKVLQIDDYRDSSKEKGSSEEEEPEEENILKEANSGTSTARG